MAMVYQMLSRLPSYIDIDVVDDVIKQAHELYNQHPPTSLRTEVRSYLKERYRILFVFYFFCTLQTFHFFTSQGAKSPKKLFVGVYF